MISALQKRFVRVSMTAITILILILLGGINILNMVIIKGEINRTVTFISENSMKRDDFSSPPEMNVGGTPFMPNGNESRLLSSPYFVVEADFYGNVLHTDLNSFSSLTLDEIKELVLKAFENGDASGKVDSFRFQKQVNFFSGTVTLTFMDTSNEIYSYLRVLLLSAAVGITCWIFMLLVVVILSKKAIKPFARNIEKQAEFITNAGHELKTPLAIIQSNADAMELYQGESKWSKNIKAQTKRLDGLMKNLLLLSRSDETPLTASPSEFSLTDTLAEEIESYKEPFKLKDVSFDCEIDQNISLKADKEQIISLISVLLDNALKYTNDGGEFKVFLKREKDSIVLQTQNTCTFLPDVPAERLFERFYRSDKTRNQATGGYGIGLSVAKAITEANGGKITASYSGGNRIIFTVCFRV